MPSRRTYLTALCSGTFVLAGCLSRRPDDRSPGGEPVGAETHIPPAPDESDDTPGTPHNTPESRTADVDTLDIRDFGAAVDGETDDTEAVREAILAATEGDTVRFPPGTTLVTLESVEESSPIVLDSERVPPNLTLTGDGWHSEIRLADDQVEDNNVVTLTGDESFEGLELRHFRIDGNRAGQRTDGGHGIRLDGPPTESMAANLTIRNLWVENCTQTGISLWRGGVELDRCTVRNCRTHGISVGLGGRRDEDRPPVVIRRSLCTRNGTEQGTYGINCSGGNVTVEDCVCANNGQGTKTTDGSINVTYRRVRLENNEFNGYIRAGSQTLNRAVVRFEDVVARNNGATGFRLSRSTDYEVPTEILASANGAENVRITNDATIEAARVWSNRANDSPGLVSDSVLGGRIQTYHPYQNGDGSLDINDRLDIEEYDIRDNEDLETVPTALDVGAETTPDGGRGRPAKQKYR